HRQRLAVAIGDLPAVGGNRHMAHAALVALILQEAFVQHMQLDDSPAHGDAAYGECADDQPETPGMKTAIGTGHQGLEVEFLHGRTSITSLGSGTRMPSFWVAMRSTRWCAVQVLCSRTRRP